MHFFYPPLFASTRDSQSSGFNGPKSAKEFVTLLSGELAYSNGEKHLNLLLLLKTHLKIILSTSPHL